MTKTLTIGIRIDSINPVHTRISIFTAMIYHDVDAATATRGKAGDLCMDTDGVADFIERLQPDRITVADGVDMAEVTKRLNLA